MRNKQGGDKRRRRRRYFLTRKILIGKQKGRQERGSSSLTKWLFPTLETRKQAAKKAKWQKLKIMSVVKTNLSG